MKGRPGLRGLVSEVWSQRSGLRDLVSEVPSQRRWEAEAALPSSQELADRRYEDRAGARLGEDGVASGSKGGLRLFRRVAGDHDDTHMPGRGVRTQAPAQREPVHDRHIDIGDDDVRCDPARDIQRLDSVGGLECLHPRTAQKALVDFPDIRRVVHHQDAGGLFHFAQT